MEWVEITAKSIEEARDQALDQLGVDEQDAEIEVLEEPRAGLFGRVRGEARVRSRVRPTQAGPRGERRDHRRGGGSGSGGGGGGRESASRPSRSDAPEQTDEGDGGAPAPAPRPARERGRDTTKGTDMPELTIDEQADVVAGFLTGLAEAFGIEGSSTATERVEADTVEVRLDGADLGLLIGPKGQTLQLIQELARTVVQRRGGGTQEGRIRIDVAGYRQRRREALERFTQAVAADVVASGQQKALEPMHPADRKVVHDTVNDIDGVRTISEGEEPRRRVVLIPATDD